MDGGSECYASAANDVGQIAGIATVSDGSEHAFVWQDGVSTDMGTLQVFEGVPFPNAINDQGTAVGHINGPYTMHAFQWDGGVVDLDPNRRYVATDARSVNDAGEAVGSASSAEEIDDGEAVHFTRTKIVRLQDEITNLGKWQWLRPAISSGHLDLWTSALAYDLLRRWLA